MAVENFKVGWLFVCFDLPVKKKAERKRATAFRKFLLDDGFQMLQYSVYVRSCVSFARQGTHVSRVNDALPPEGEVRVFFITRAQWQRSYIFHGKPMKRQTPEPFPEQMMLWEDLSPPPDTEEDEQELLL